MTAFHGKDGVVKIGANTVAEVTSFDVNRRAATADTTAMGDTWETHLAGQSSWEGSLTCHWDDTDTTGQGALTVGASVTLNLYPEGDTTGDFELSGTATVTEVGVAAAHDGVVQATFSFRGNGALTEGTAS